MSRFKEIRGWAQTRGLYDSGDTKTQYVKLMEEAGELARGILKEDQELLEDSIGDCVVVLTNLAHLAGTSIEDCIEKAWDEIKDRKGSMKNNTFVKEETKEEKDYVIYLDIHKNGYYNLPGSALRMPGILKTTQIYLDGDSYPDEVILSAMKPSRNPRTGGVAYVYPEALYNALAEYESSKTK